MDAVKASIRSELEQRDCWLWLLIVQCADVTWICVKANSQSVSLPKRLGGLQINLLRCCPTLPFDYKHNKIDCCLLGAAFLVARA